MTVFLSDKIGSDGAAAQSRLLDGFERFTAGLDLAPMRRYAASQ